MNELTRLSFEELINFDETTLTGAYQVINGTGTENSLSIFKFYNSSADLVILSFDGTTDHDFVPPGGTFILDVQTNADGYGDSGGHKSLRQGQQVWAKTSSNTDRLIMVGYY